MRKSLAQLLALLLLLSMTPCALADTTDVADVSQMTTVEEVVEEGMTPVYPESLADGEYPVTVECSSSMFRIETAVLNVRDGNMSAVLTMGGKSYLYVFPGEAQAAAAADESAYIPFDVTESGAHSFTIPVEALDAPVPCAAYSKNKEQWYARTLLFRADSLPVSAFREGFFTTAESLGLADGRYTVNVTLAGGSGRASVQSPAALNVAGGKCSAVIVWSSKNYDYMKADGEKFLPIPNEDAAAFEIPVLFFDRPMAVIADTVAMSEPHEIRYTLRFDSKSLEAAP